MKMKVLPDKPKNADHGFSLTELLISLLIIGQIAVFTIPKLLVSQQNQKYRAIAKETAGTLVNAYMVYRTKNTVSTSTHNKDVIPFINYIKYETSGSVDRDAGNGAGTFSCSASNPCLRMANGSVIWFYDYTFLSTTNGAAIAFMLDPDGKVTGVSDSLWFYVYYNGLTRTEVDCLNPTSLSDGYTCTPGANPNPAWFSWS